MSRVVFKTTAGASSGSGGDGRPPGNFKVVEFPPGAEIFHEGDLGTEMYIVQDGKVQITKEVVGGETEVLAVFERGDFFGEMSLLEELPRTASACALTAARLIEINGTTFDKMLRANPEIAVRMMRKLSRRLRETDRLLQERGGAAQVSERPPAEATSDKVTAPQRFLHAKTGMEFFLAQARETTVGRRDPVTGIHPDIDLTPVDDKRSISRRHAKVFRHDEKFWVTEEIGTMNGTFVNGVRIETGVPVEIKNGDEVNFGLVPTVFHAD
jgi:CRP-like cAMP-binding protein